VLREQRSQMVVKRAFSPTLWNIPAALALGAIGFVNADFERWNASDLSPERRR